jgi:acetylornithine/succinyldiaminopimelate/putrescine aminotransferase
MQSCASQAHITDEMVTQLKWSHRRDGEDSAVQAKSTLTQGDIIRLAPPLIINREQILECADIIHTTVASFDASLTADHPVQAA